MDELKILSPCGILGYGYPKESFLKGIKLKPDVIAVDAGSTDAGPHKLGSGEGIVSRIAVKKDLELMLIYGYELGIPIIIGSAGGAGAKTHVDWTMEIIEEIIFENKLTFKTAIINADVNKEFIKNKMKSNDVYPLGYAPDLYEQNVDDSIRIVGQMGVEPIIKALKEGAQLIVAGRAYDPTVFAALPILKGYDHALSYHLGKILECGALCADPGTTKDCIMGYLGEDYFIVESLNENRNIYTTSVAAHTLYEKEHPYILHGPGIELDLSQSKFEQYTETTVKVTGSKIKNLKQYTIKLEGAKVVAYRTICIAGIRDPLMISKIDEINEAVEESVKTYFDNIPSDDYQIIFHVYGKNAVLRDREPVKDTKSHELGIIIDVVAKSQEIAKTICSACRSTLLHYGYEGRKSTAGNLAFPYSPSDIQTGPVYKFTLYHLVNMDDPCRLFPIRYIEYKGGKHA